MVHTGSVYWLLWPNKLVGRGNCFIGVIRTRGVHGGDVDEHCLYESSALR